ncbi:MAG TPA: hypothetical protein VMH05_02810 [Bryobacteraceae bacterium]|nr:hypothetical protein [Bryobacteraceae bacterium]
MNYRQGFLRIYLVLSVCWIAAWIYAGVKKSPDLRLNEAKRQELDGVVRTMMDEDETDDDIQVVVDDFRQKYGERSWPLTLRRVVTSDTMFIAFLPPLAGYAAAFIVLPWIAGGFGARKID